MTGLTNTPLPLPDIAQSADRSGPLDLVNGALSRMDILNHPDELLDGLSNLHLVWGSVFLVVGTLCIINGYRYHKRVVVVCAFLGGLGLGHLLSQQIAESRVIVMASVGLLCAVVAAPMLRIAVAVFAGMTGAFIGANVWTMVRESQDSHLVGAMMGFVAVGLLSFILYKPVVMLFTSFGGAAMAVLGGIALVLQVPGWYDAVHNSLTGNQMLVPLFVAVAGTVGLVLQQSNGSLSEPGGGGGSGGGGGGSAGSPAHT